MTAREIWQFPDFVVPFRLIIAPTQRQAQLFIRDMRFYPPECKVAREPIHLRTRGRLETWEVWWLDRLWPCRTHEDVAKMEEMMALARLCGADIRRWYT